MHCCMYRHTPCIQLAIYVPSPKNYTYIQLAHELRSWLLHYSPVALLNILPEEYYQHHLLLVEGIYLLLKDVVEDADWNKSNNLLRHYCFMYSPLYGRNDYNDVNVHA